MAAISGITFFILDFGKLFSTFSVLHNIFEVGILLLLIQGGKITTNYFYAIVGTYLFIVMLLNISLPWPYDAVWFKTQDYVREQTAALLPMAENEDHLPSDDAPNISPKVIEHPEQLLLLIFASFVHIIGNSFTTLFSGDGRAVAFPCYALYIYFDTHCTSVIHSKRILVPDTSGRKVILITLWTLILTLITIRLAFVIGSF
ncbi:16092_t:CDS:2 [Cetraspora pellucida]|uniref:16092_t:CDS:1 n=1 Tax=Cetraspora pellucida TaxID=1433469 RepID=A0A9N8ZZ25_9GLOM|nr:16092_t:CDS:2 [Cetraspora pellucida]